MENSVFSASHLPSQALVVLSEAASGLHEALRNQRPFHSRLSEAKNLHNMSLVGNYGTHLLHSFHPHLIPGMLSGGGGGGSSNFFNGNRSSLKTGLSGFQLPSAFSPPKYIGISLDQGMFNGSSEPYRTDSSSPTVSSLSPLTKPDSMEGKMLDYESDKMESPRSNSDSMDLNRAHSNKSHHHANNPPNTCPVCGASLSNEDWNSHFLMELDRLYKLSLGSERQLIEQSFSSMSSMQHSPQETSSFRTTQNRWETFRRIRANRQNRLRIKVRKRKYGSEMYYYDNLFCNSCPICQRKFPTENTRGHEEDPSVKDEVETVDVESCYDDAPDSGSDASSNNRLDGGVLYKSVCLINKETADEGLSGWETNPGAGSIEKRLSATPNYYASEPPRYETNHSKPCENINNNEEDSDEDVIVDDEKVNSSTVPSKSIGKDNDTDSREEDTQSEHMVTSTEQSDSTGKANMFEELRAKINDLENPNNDKTPPKNGEDEFRCFICKTGLDSCSDFFRGKTVCFHQSCANIMSSCRNIKGFV